MRRPWWERTIVNQLIAEDTESEVAGHLPTNRAPQEGIQASAGIGEPHVKLTSKLFVPHYPEGKDKTNELSLSDRSGTITGTSGAFAQVSG